MLWTVLAILATLILLFMVRRRAAYKKLFGDEHFLEIAEGVARLKAAALAHIETPDTQVPVTREDARVLITGQNLRVFYTVTQDENSYEHHYSLSIANGYTARAVGEIFSLYLVHLFNLTPQNIAIERSQRGIFHVEWRFDEQEHSNFARRPLIVPPRETLPQLYDTLNEWRAEIKVQPTQILPELKTQKHMPGQ